MISVILAKIILETVLVGKHAVIFAEINSPRFISVGNVCVENGIFSWNYSFFNVMSPPNPGVDSVLIAMRLLNPGTDNISVNKAPRS